MTGAIEAFEAELIKPGGWIGRHLSRSEDLQAAFSPESSDTSATEPGGRVFKEQE